MKIKKIEVNNFRALKKFSIDLDDDISIIIGKNNTGKTSLLTIMDYFLSESKANFKFHDFNKEYVKKFYPLNSSSIISAKEYVPFCTSMILHIEYTEDDYIGNLSKFFMDLDPKIRKVVLSFEYVMTYELYIAALNDYKKYRSKNRKNNRTIREYTEKNFAKYFKILVKALNLNNKEFVEIKEKTDIQKIINFKYIRAIRDVNNSELNDRKSHTLSKLAQEYYKVRKQDILDESLLDDVLKESDVNLDKSYKKIFKEVISDIERFSYGKKEAKLSVKSMLEASTLLKENANVIYNKDSAFLPEEYNGLGYMNLFAMIFHINIQIDEFRKISKFSDVPSDINILYIEEPEAHTHPQMQYVFIKNIQNKLEEGRKGKDGETEINLQMLLSSHSSHIVSQSDFDKIKFFYRKNEAIYSKNLSELRVKMKKGDPDENRYKFLKQYLTLDRAELFFADKAIFIEGDTERILLNAMMKKIDLENKDNEKYIPLLSQNISTVEVGAYSHVFDEFIEYLGIKALIITDIDSIDVRGGEKCEVKDGNYSSNSSLKHFFGDDTLSILKQKEAKDKVLKKTNSWIPNKKGTLMIAYQTEENGYYPRSFEDAFLNCNFNFVESNKINFQGLKNRENIVEGESCYTIAAKCIDKKSVFATDILYYSDEAYSNWTIPTYIKEGLEWLAK